jgi:DNA-binding Lrp family transcriptional regulator
MNKTEKARLKASIAEDLAQGQGEHSPTRVLLRQYAPLEGIITTPAPDAAGEFGASAAMENCIAPRATVARNDTPAWHGATVVQDATVAPHATVARYAMVRGELRVPNTINFSLFPTLEPFAKAVYYQLFLLSHGFRRDTCVVGLAKLAKAVLMSPRKVQNTIAYLEKRGLIKRVGSKLGGRSRGNFYQVPLPVTNTALSATVACDATVAEDAALAPSATVARHATVARGATNKDDDDIKTKSSSKGRKLVPASEPVENHRSAAAPRERQESADPHLARIRDAYQKATGNRWNISDLEVYEENGLQNLAADKVIAAIELVALRTPTKVNSFRYFVKEIVALPDPLNRAWHKKQLEKVVRRVRDNAVGRGGYFDCRFR